MRGWDKVSAGWEVEEEETKPVERGCGGRYRGGEWIKIIIQKGIKLKGFQCVCGVCGCSRGFVPRERG